MLAAPRQQLIAEYDVQFPEITSIPADDGFPMPATILKPKDFRADRRYPVIVFIYGGPSAPQVRKRLAGRSFVEPDAAQRGLRGSEG
jgi:dipeptidyl-peptidase-4